MKRIEKILTMMLCLSGVILLAGCEGIDRTYEGSVKAGDPDRTKIESGLKWLKPPARIRDAATEAEMTMLVGSVLAVTQTDIKRMLAYSSITHTGFILTGLIALGSTGSGDGLSATLFYLFVYGLATVSAFALVTVVRDDNGEVARI